MVAWPRTCAAAEVEISERSPPTAGGGEAADERDAPHVMGVRRDFHDFCDILERLRTVTAKGHDSHVKTALAGEIRAFLLPIRRIFRLDCGVDAPLGGDVQTEIAEVPSHDVCSCELS